MEPKYLYLFKSRDGYYKIGISSNVESRLASIRTSNHDHVDIVFARKVKEALSLEQELHKRYAHRISRKDGEWFSLTSEEVIDICIEINLAEGEKPKAENHLLEKTLQKFLAGQEQILTLLKNQKIRQESVSEKSPQQEPRQLSPATQVSTQKKQDDVLIKDAIDIISKEGRASASLLQSKLSIGYARAARIIDKLEELGIVGPHNGSLPRTIKTSTGGQLPYRSILFSKPS